MKLRTLSTFIAAACRGLASRPGRCPSEAWRDAQVNAINRLPMHATFFAYGERGRPVRGDKRASERYLSLNGDWRYSWAKDADERPTDFYRTDYSDGHWGRCPCRGSGR